MQTLISAFDDLAAARRAVEKLVQSGVAREDVHLQEPPPAEPFRGVDPVDRELGERTMASAEREVAVDRDVLTAIGHFFVSILGKDHHPRHARTYSEAVRRGHPVVVVDTRTDEEAEHAATLLHQVGAINVDERAQAWRASGWTDETSPAGDTLPEPGGNAAVRVFQRASQPPLREIVGGRSAQVSSNMEDTGDAAMATERERAMAAGRSSEPPVAMRDPDAAGRSLTGTRQSDRDKPGGY